MSTNHKQTLGHFGEQIAKDFLLRKNYKIITTNWHKRCGEIDIIAQEPDGQLVFVEVKTREKTFGQVPEFNLTYKKIQKIDRTIMRFFVNHPEFEFSYRIDAIAIETDRPNNKVFLRHHKSIG